MLPLDSPQERAREAWEADLNHHVELLSEALATFNFSCTRFVLSKEATAQASASLTNVPEPLEHEPAIVLALHDEKRRLAYSFDPELACLATRMETVQEMATPAGLLRWRESLRKRRRAVVAEFKDTLQMMENFLSGTLGGKVTFLNSSKFLEKADSIAKSIADGSRRQPTDDLATVLSHVRL